ncbi:toxin biosynthesis protein [Aspergillus sclerotioniger CBS 115572]|uniref:Toxin biosynthesis protein n=1 Tax=Aspergillus sclerotioniger CBS 115572 TaxID=1450535 RepID=A0A317X6F3_9EURO|nr:toxin biosynthesis protein [Aspergillus sclerotioniger CBS 115572]PWY93905.1 toxin biosynthesis protein [Aspergillus sclerotioniger CBS 115572]
MGKAVIMSSSQFRVIEHVIPCQSVREYHHAVRTDSPPLQLAVKEYVPLDDSEPASDGVTIIAGHANGIPKECYEPIWNELVALKGVKIKGIWFADCVNQGASGVVNEDVLGDDPNWFDHSRDLLHMVNHFRDQIKPPIVGIAHSFSCATFVHLSVMHPRLFHSLIFLEPMVQVESPSKAGGRSPALWASSRPDLWPSREAATTFIRSNPFWRNWDPRAVNQYLQYGLRPTPTALYPNASSDAVTLATTKAQEAWTYLRFNATPQAGNDDPTERLLGPDLATTPNGLTTNNPEYVAVCPWCSIAFEFLQYVRPSVLFVFGEKSHINVPERRKDKLERTGTGLGGSGGVVAGRVKAEVLPGTSHLAPLEKIHDTAWLLSGWLEEQMKAYRAEKEFFGQYTSGKSDRDAMGLSAKWMEYIKQPVDTKRARKAHL